MKVKEEEKKKKRSHPQLLLLGQQVVVLVTLVQCHQHVLQPIPHAQGELLNLRVQAGLDDYRGRGGMGLEDRAGGETCIIHKAPP